MKIANLIMMLLGVFLFVACNRDDTPPPLPTPRTDALTLDLDYAEKSYLIDGIGRAELATCEDGDTAEFIVDNQQIRVRFLGIDTPEASHFYEPWGYQATQFVCGKLEVAETIVLERNFDGVLRDTYGRYLAFIWADGRLINLEVIEKAYSEARGAVNLKYGSALMEAMFAAEETGRRIHGETDPLFDYSETGKDTTLGSIVNHPDDYNFKKVNVTGVVTRMLGIHAYIQADGYGMYFYIGHNPSSDLAVGNRVRLDNVRAVIDLERRGGIHLTDFPRAQVRVLETGIITEPLAIGLSAFTSERLGRLIVVSDLTIQAVTEHIDGSLTLAVRDASGQSTTILHARKVEPSNRLDVAQLSVGDTVDVTGLLRNSPSGWHILLVDREDLVIYD